MEHKFLGEIIVHAPGELTDPAINRENNDPDHYRVNFSNVVVDVLLRLNMDMGRQHRDFILAGKHHAIRLFLEGSAAPKTKTDNDVYMRCIFRDDNQFNKWITEIGGSLGAREFREIVTALDLNRDLLDKAAHMRLERFHPSI